MTSPKANEMPSRSAPVIAGVLLPARTSVATTEPGPTRTSSAVPRVSASARCGRECSIAPPDGDSHSIMSNAVSGAKLLPRAARVKRDGGRRAGLDAEALGRGHAGDPGHLAVALDDGQRRAIGARDPPIDEEVLQRLGVAAHPERRHAVAGAPGADRQRPGGGEDAVARLG